MIEVVAYEPELKNRWNQFVTTAKNGHFMFDRGYMDCHPDRLPDRSLLFVKKDKVVALLPAHGPASDDTDPGAVISHEGLPFGGIISGRTMNIGTMREVFDALLSFFHAQGWSQLIYRAIPHLYHAYPAQEDIFSLIEHGATQIDTRVTCAVRIGSPPDYDESRRHLVENPANQTEVEVGEYHDLDKFQEMLCESSERHPGVSPVPSRDELRLLIERFPKDIKILGALRKGELLAAEMLLISQTCYRVQCKGSSEAGVALHASDLIEDYVIRNYGQAGRWFDFGTSIVPESDVLDKSLIEYKESFGARAVLQNTYRLETGSPK